MFIFKCLISVGTIKYTFLSLAIFLKARISEGEKPSIMSCRLIYFTPSEGNKLYKQKKSLSFSFLNKGEVTDFQHELTLFCWQEFSVGLA